MSEENKNIKDTAENEKKPMPAEPSPEKPEKKKKIRKLTIVKFIAILLVASMALLCASMYAYKHREAIKEAAKVTPTVDASQAADSTVTTALPDSLTENSSITVLVDKTHKLPKDYVPSDLTTPYLNSTSDVIQLRSEAGTKAKEMKDAAAAAGVTLVVSAGYRSYETQAELYQDRVDLVGEEKAKKIMAEAGCSEHQTGLAIDFTDDPANNNMTEAFADTAAGQWLAAHAHEYGYILRYPKGKEKITGYSYMPWHYRYVGVDVSNAMYAIGADETFEEYFNVSK